MGKTADGQAGLPSFSAATAAWFESAFAAPTDAQRGAWSTVASGRNALVVAPTGSGKTLAAFLWALDGLVSKPVPKDKLRRCRVLYVSPLKALAVDIERNLRAPLAGIHHASVRLGLPEPDVRVGVRSGDTSPEERRRIATTPPDILITTPESLFLLLTSQAREALRGVETVIVDEVHAVAGTKRGAHLALSLERLDALLDRPAQRVGLSATVRPVESVARYLGGEHPVDVVQPPSSKTLEIAVEVTVEDMTALGEQTGPSVLQDMPVLDWSNVDTETGDVLGPVGSFSEGDGPSAAATADHSTASFPAPFADNFPDVFAAQPGPAGPAPGEPGALFPATVPGGSTMGGGLDNRASIWPSIERRVLDLVRAHRSTIVFANSRRLAERLCSRLNELAAADAGLEPPDPMMRDRPPAEYAAQSGSGQGSPAAGTTTEDGRMVEVARPHHGSMSREQRTLVEEALKSGRLPCVVATSSLELGIDMGAVDLVVQVESPPSVASGLQRIGRAGHQVGAASRGVVLPKHRGDLLPCTVVAERMRDGAIESLTPPRNPLDVLAQQIVAMVAMEDWSVDDLAALVRRSAAFTALPQSALEATLDMLAGRYPSDAFAELRPRIVWDRVAGTLSGRPGAQRLAVTSGGTIPDRGLFGVFLAAGGEGGSGRRVGELDEEMVYESR
ncbi:MAG: ATP-dependent helicase Lhr and Lhr-like helicase, partial [Frankiaceae bacterium]|nr:ATP-dependent helicase Lhr and Lhr-like helicase [Frankiaceae bacterium]